MLIIFNIILHIIGLACVGVLWINSEPTILLRTSLFKFIYKDKSFNGDMIWRLLNCCMCSTFHIYFWFELILTGKPDIIGAAISAIIAEFISRALNKGNLL